MLLRLIDPVIPVTFFRASKPTFSILRKKKSLMVLPMYIKSPGCIPSPPAVSQAPGPWTGPCSSHLHTTHFSSLERLQIQPWYVSERWHSHICSNRLISLYNILTSPDLSVNVIAVVINRTFAVCFCLYFQWPLDRCCSSNSQILERALWKWQYKSGMLMCLNFVL